MSYRWEWGWHAETGWKPESFSLTDAQIDEFIREKVAQKLVEEYTKKGYSISVDNVTTVAKIDVKARRVDHGVKLQRKYIVDAKTTTVFGTDAPVMGSPIDPATIAVISAVILAVIGLAKLVLLFSIFNTINNTLHDIGTGVSEALGLPGQAGLGVLFIIILLIIGLWIVGKYFWRKRK